MSPHFLYECQMLYKIFSVSKNLSPHFLYEHQILCNIFSTSLIWCLRLLIHVLECGSGSCVVCCNFSLCYGEDLLALVGWFSFKHALLYAASSDWYVFLMQDGTPSSFPIGQFLVSHKKDIRWNLIVQCNF